MTEKAQDRIDAYLLAFIIMTAIFSLFSSLDHVRDWLAYNGINEIGGHMSFFGAFIFSLPLSALCSAAITLTAGLDAWVSEITEKITLKK